MSAEEAAFQAGVEAMRAQVLAYLTDPQMRQSFVMMGPRVLAVVAHEVEAMHPGYVKAWAAKVSDLSIDRIGEAADRAATQK